MPNKIECILDEIIKSIQNNDFDNTEKLFLILNPSEIVSLSAVFSIEELQALQKKVHSAIGILNTHKALMLDELTLIHKSRKALDSYG